MISNDQTKVIVAFITLGMALLSLVGLFFIEVPEKNRELINIFLGALIGWSGAVISFYFGDTARVVNKDDKQ